MTLWTVLGTLIFAAGLAIEVAVAGNPDALIAGGLVTGFGGWVLVCGTHYES